MNILTWRNNVLKGTKTSQLIPLNVADTLEYLSNVSLAALKNLPKSIHNSPAELNQTLSDIEGFALIGKYYAEKIRAACDLAMFDTTKSEQLRKSALLHLEYAKQYWHGYSAIYSVKNKPALYNRVGYVDVEKLKKNVEEDINIVRNWEPGSGQLKTNGNTEVPFKQ
jgi:hypothetical protein